MHERVEHGSWLHGQLRDVASELVGIDVSPGGIRAAAEQGFEVHLADCEDAASIASLALEPADLVLAGELIEHLSAPGRMLDAARPLVRAGGEMMVTTPNAHALTNVLAGIAGLELVNSDHVGWQSWWTLTEMLRRHVYTVTDVAYYPYPHLTSGPATPPAHRLRVRAFNGYLTAARPLYRLRPSLAEGLIVSATPTG